MLDGLLENSFSMISDMSGLSPGFDKSVRHDKPNTHISTATEAFDRLEANRRSTLDPMDTDNSSIFSIAAKAQDNRRTTVDATDMEALLKGLDESDVGDLLEQSIDISLLDDESLFPGKVPTDLPSANRSQQSSSLKITKLDMEKKEEDSPKESANSHIYYEGDEKDGNEPNDTEDHQSIEITEDFTDNSNIFSVVQTQDNRRTTVHATDMESLLRGLDESDEDNTISCESFNNDISLPHDGDVQSSKDQNSSFECQEGLPTSAFKTTSEADEIPSPNNISYGSSRLSYSDNSNLVNSEDCDESFLSSGSRIERRLTADPIDIGK
jgi:histone H3/H4